MTDEVTARGQAGVTGSTLTVPAAMMDSIIQHLADALPNEGVGLLAVAPDHDHWPATAFIPGSNVDRSPTRYTMDPAEVVAGLRMIEANGWRLGAIVHSHVSSPPTPSATDLREAYYPDALMLIVGFGTGQADPRLWRVNTGVRMSDPVEIALVIESGEPIASARQRSACPDVISQENYVRDS